MSRGVVTLNSWVEEVWEGLRLQTEDVEKIDGVEKCGTEDVSMD